MANMVAYFNYFLCFPSIIFIKRAKRQIPLYWPVVGLYRGIIFIPKMLKILKQHIPFDVIFTSG